MTDLLKKVCEDKGINPELPIYDLCNALMVTVEENKDGDISVHLPLSVLSDNYLLRGKLCQEIESLYQRERQQSKDKQGVLPSDWMRAIETLQSRQKPKDIKDERWQDILKRLNRLVEQETDHLLKIIEYGWSLEEVFGCHKFAPDVRIDGMGLLMLLGKASIAEIKPRCASLKHKDDGMITYALGTFDRMCMEYSMLMELP
jgi:hypothetical protein